MVAPQPQVLTDLADARFHARAGSEIDDATLRRYIVVAEGIVAHAVGRRQLLGGADGWLSIGSIPAPVIHAIRVVLVDIYDNRGESMLDELTLDRLIGRSKRISFG